MTVEGKNRVCLVVIVVLLLVIAAMVYKFIVAGSTQPGEDGRVAIVLEPGERTLMLREMRGFVAGIQQMTDALSRDDMKAVAEAGRSVGMARASDAPASMLGKLPLAFKKLAFGTHGGFDKIAADADAGGTPKQALAQLAGVLQNCVACHAEYQVKTVAAH